MAMLACGSCPTGFWLDVERFVWTGGKPRRGDPKPESRWWSGKFLARDGAGVGRSRLAQSTKLTGGAALPDEHDFERDGELQTGPTAAGGANIPSAPDFDGPRPWGRADRNRLLIWAAIGFLFPGLLIFALHLQGKSSDAVFSVRSELPVKALAAFFVALATWIVSRMDKRPLDDYGIPPR